MSFYAYNIIVKGPTQSEISTVLHDSGIHGLLTPQQHDCCVFSSDECNEADEISRIASSISTRLQCLCLAVHNYDDAILWYRLYNRGNLADEYDSCPDYFDFDFVHIPPRGPEGGDTKKLCDLWLGNSEMNKVINTILHRGLEIGGDIEGFEDQLQVFLDQAPAIAKFPAAMPDAMRQEITDKLKVMSQLHSEDRMTPKPEDIVIDFHDAVDALPSPIRISFMATFSKACGFGGVGEDAAERAMAGGISSERERHAALIAALNIPVVAVALCGEDDDLAPEGSVYL